MQTLLKRGFSPTLRSANLFLSCLLRAGKYQLLLHVFSQVSSNVVPTDSRTEILVAHAFLKSRRFEEAERLIARSEKSHLSRNWRLWDALIRGVCVAGEDPDKGFVLLQECVRNIGVGPSVWTFRLLVMSFCSRGNVDKAIEVVGEMTSEKVGYPVDSFVCVSIVSGLCKLGSLELALAFLENVWKNGDFAPGLMTYTAVVDALCRDRMSEMAIKVLSYLTSRGVILEVKAHRMLIITRYKEDQGEGVLELLRSLDELQPDAHSLICNDAIAFLCRRNCCEFAMELYVLARRKGSVVTTKSYYVLLKNLLRNGNMYSISLVMSSCIKEYGLLEPRVVNVLSLFLCKIDVEKALQFLDQRENKNIFCSVSTTVVDSLKRVGRIEDAYRYLMEAEGHGMAVDVVTYSIAVDGLCKEGYLEKALVLCSSMRDRGVKPNIFTYNSVINGLCQQGCLVEAFRIFDSLEANYVTPTVVTYSTLIRTLCREGYLTDAMQLFEKMQCNSVMPNLHVYNSFINGYCSFGLVREAVQLLQRLEDSSMQPDAFTVSSVVYGFCVQGNMEGALGFYTEYERRGITLDFLGFFFLIEGLCDKGRLEEARSILQDMLQCQSVIDIINTAGIKNDGESFASLLGFLCEQGRIEDAVSVLTEVGSLTDTTGRFIDMQTARKTAYKVETFDADKRVENSDREGPSVLELSEKTGGEAELGAMMLETDYSNLGLHKECGKDSRMDDIENQIGKLKFHNFDIYYPVIASLCSKGEWQKASTILKRVLMNSGGCL